MKIFISWSGNLSKIIAEIFRQWIPAVIQAAKPYYSPDDITKGTRWSNEISKELDLSRIGIICLTKQNLNSSWIMFEAGALSKNIEKTKLVPLLFGIEPSEVQGPLVQFQAAKFSKVEMKKVIKMINSEVGPEGTLPPEVLDSVFEMWWPKLENQIREVEEKSKSTNNKELRSDRDLLEEVLSLTRQLSITPKVGPRRNALHLILEVLVDSARNMIYDIVINKRTQSAADANKLIQSIDDLVTEAIDSGYDVSGNIYHTTNEMRKLVDELVPKNIENRKANDESYQKNNQQTSRKDQNIETGNITII